MEENPRSESGLVTVVTWLLPVDLFFFVGGVFDPALADFLVLLLADRCDGVVAERFWVGGTMVTKRPTTFLPSVVVDGCWTSRIFRHLSWLLVAELHGSTCGSQKAELFDTSCWLVVADLHCSTWFSKSRIC